MVAGELLCLSAQDAQAGGRGRSGGTHLPLTLVPHFPPRRFHWHSFGVSLVGAAQDDFLEDSPALEGDAALAAQRRRGEGRRKKDRREEGRTRRGAPCGHSNSVEGSPKHTQPGSCSARLEVGSRAVCTQGLVPTAMTVPTTAGRSEVSTRLPFGSGFGAIAEAQPCVWSAAAMRGSLLCLLVAHGELVREGAGVLITLRDEPLRPDKLGTEAPRPPASSELSPK